MVEIEVIVVRARGNQEAGAKVQIGAELLCKDGKVEAGKITEYGVQSSELKGMR
jgi:hypothetical protein